MSESESLIVLIVVAVTIVSAPLILRKMRDLRQSLRLKFRISDIVAGVSDGITADDNTRISCSAPILRFRREVLAKVCSGMFSRFYILVEISFACAAAMTVVIRGAGLVTVTPVLWVGILSSGIVAVGVPGACGVGLRVLGDLALRSLSNHAAASKCCSGGTQVVGCGCGVRLDVCPSLVVSAFSWALQRLARSGIAVAAELTIAAALLRLSVRHYCGQSLGHGTIASREK